MPDSRTNNETGRADGHADERPDGRAEERLDNRAEARPNGPADGREVGREDGPAEEHEGWLRRAERWTPPTRHRVAGADEDGSGASFRVLSPRDGRELAVVADAGEREVDRAVAAA
ncbi:hypothetical protein ADK38_27995, partial [Streptomyces varsoviensis]